MLQVVGILVLAIFAPEVAAVGHLVIGILILLRAHGDEPGTRTVASRSPDP